MIWVELLEMTEGKIFDVHQLGEMANHTIIYKVP
jgi:hypothetical protein